MERYSCHRGVRPYRYEQPIEGVGEMTVRFEKINASGSWQIFDQAAHRLLGIDAATFVQRWDSGSYASDASTDVMKVAMLRPSGR